MVHKHWLPLESNPEVMNDFAGKLGLDTTAHAFCDIYGLDEELLAMVPQPVLAVLLLFPITKEIDDAARQEDAARAAAGAADINKVFYMKQTIGNACGTIAILHAVENAMDSVKCAPDSFFTQFAASTAGMSPAERGAFLENPPQGAPDIETAHQAAANEGATAPPAPDADVDLHFIAFVHRDGCLYELDGRRAGPVNHGATSAATLLPDTVKVVQRLMERTNSVNFNMIALAPAQDA